MINLSNNLIKNRVTRFVFSLVLNIVWIIFIFMLLIVLAPDYAISIISFLIVAISLTFRNLINNISAGVMIIASEQFNVGDLVEIDGIHGIVDEITLNYTKMRQLDGVITYIPNNNIYGSSIKKFTYKITKMSSKEIVESKKREKIREFVKHKVLLNKKKFTKYVRTIEILPTVNPKKIRSIIKPVFEKYKSIFGYEPTAVVDTTGVRLSLTLQIRVDNPELILQYFDILLRDLLIALYNKQVYDGWDAYKRANYDVKSMEGGV